MAKVTMSTVWDRSAEVLAGRTGMLASIAALALWLPPVLRHAIGLALLGTPPVITPGTQATMGLVNIVVSLLTIFGQLAIVAVASDPATHRRDAFRIAGRRLLLTIGLTLLLVLVLLVLLAPVFVLLARSGVTAAALQSGTVSLPAGYARSLSLYALVLAAFGLWTNARLLPFLPIVVNERRGIGSFADAFRLTRGHSWRILGVIVLFAIISIVALLAVNFVVGSIVALLFGRGSAITQMLLTAVTAIVGAAITVVASVFAAQFYVARRGAEAPAFE